MPAVLRHSRHRLGDGDEFPGRHRSPTRFARSKTVGAHFGLTPRREQSDILIDFDGHISKRGDGPVRTALYEAASAMITRSRKPCVLKPWGEPTILPLNGP